MLNGAIEISFTLNNQATTLKAYPMERLLDVLREKANLTGTKEGCGEGECGACSIMLDGHLVNSCLIPFAQVKGRSIVTIEALETVDGQNDESLCQIQKSFLTCGGAQCGICTPGMLMAAQYFLNQEEDISKSDELKEKVKNALAGNLCRCTGYQKIFDSVLDAFCKKKSLPPKECSL